MPFKSCPSSSAQGSFMRFKGAANQLIGLPVGEGERVERALIRGWGRGCIRTW